MKEEKGNESIPGDGDEVADDAERADEEEGEGGRARYRLLRHHLSVDRGQFCETFDTSFKVMTEGEELMSEDSLMNTSQNSVEHHDERHQR